LGDDPALEPVLAAGVAADAEAVAVAGDGWAFAGVEGAAGLLEELLRLSFL
jgi:hypothetical protein